MRFVKDKLIEPILNISPKTPQYIITEPNCKITLNNVKNQSKHNDLILRSFFLVSEFMV